MAGATAAEVSSDDDDSPTLQAQERGRRSQGADWRHIACAGARACGIECQKRKAPSPCLHASQHERAVESFLASGISLHKVDEMREVFELAGHPLTHSSNLKEFIPKVLAKEVALVRAELQGQYFSISFDGTTRLGEVINVCARFVPANFECVATRLTAVKTVAKHMNGNMLFRLINLQPHYHEGVEVGHGPDRWPMSRQLCD